MSFVQVTFEDDDGYTVKSFGMGGFGLTADNQAYFDPGGVDAGDEADIAVNSLNGNLSLTRLQ